MSNPERTVYSAEDEFEAIMPDGWTGNDDADIFDPNTWGGGDTDTDEYEDEAADGDGNSEEESADSSRTTESDEDSQTDAAKDGAPTTGRNSDADNKLHFTANIDHVTKEVELDPAELPTIYQKAQVLDRYQQRVTELEADLARWDSVAAGLEFENRGALLEGLIDNAVQDYISDHPSVPEEMARDYILRKFEGAKPKTPEKTAPEPEQSSGRDFKAEVAELFRAYPDARKDKIPDEVIGDSLSNNKALVQAYADWKAKTASAKATRAERENKILKQNQAAAARAPVRKTTGGGNTDTSPSDPFLAGFNDDSAW